MGVGMKRGSIALLAAAPLAPVAASAQEAAMPAWMAGCWEMRDGERWAEECWTAPRGGQMMGSGRTGDATGVRSFEFMRIEREGQGLAFRAAPGGDGWTSFASASDPGEGVTFLNAAHDYPQRVRYWREGNELRAEISQSDGGNATQFTFRRMNGE
jgi:hypothetical protein